MARLVWLLLPPLLIAQTLHRHCDPCHTRELPYQLLYKRALLLYSSKGRIHRHLTDFLTNPDPAKSILPPGLRLRFDPAQHPRFPPPLASQAVQELIEQEDLLKKFVPLSQEHPASQSQKGEKAHHIGHRRQEDAASNSRIGTDLFQDQRDQSSKKPGG